MTKELKLSLSGISASIVIGDGLPMELTHFAMVDDPPDPNCIVLDLVMPDVSIEERRQAEVFFNPALVVFQQRIHQDDIAPWLDAMDKLHALALRGPSRYFAMDLAAPDRDATTLNFGRVTSFDPRTGLARIKFGKLRPSKGWRRHERRRKAKCRR